MTQEEIKDLELVNNEKLSRFEWSLPKGTAYVEYEKRGSKYYLTHTEVPEVYNGQGIASSLLKKVMEYLKDNNFKMDHYCSFVKKFVARHPEYLDLK